jgi:hypothetical protein
MRAVLAVVVFVLAYWPGGDGRFSSAPTYGHRIPVIDTIGVRDRAAVREWNRCGSVRLVRGGGRAPYAPGTITITTGEKGDWPRGGWFEDHGVLLLPPGSWERSIPVIRHELGHALGFGHTSRWSIMGDSNHVQPIDCQGLRRYYG